jgi:hypothetical protein
MTIVSNKELQFFTMCDLEDVLDSEILESVVEAMNSMLIEPLTVEEVGNMIYQNNFNLPNLVLDPKKPSYFQVGANQYTCSEIAFECVNEIVDEKKIKPSRLVIEFGKGLHRISYALVVKEGVSYKFKDICNKIDTVANGVEKSVKSLLETVNFRLDINCADGVYEVSKVTPDTKSTIVEFADGSRLRVSSVFDPLTKEVTVINGIPYTGKGINLTGVGILGKYTDMIEEYQFKPREIFEILGHSSRQLENGITYSMTIRNGLGEEYTTNAKPPHVMLFNTKVKNGKTPLIKFVEIVPAIGNRKTYIEWSSKNIPEVTSDTYTEIES